MTQSAIWGVFRFLGEKGCAVTSLARHLGLLHLTVLWRCQKVKGKGGDHTRMTILAARQEEERVMAGTLAEAGSDGWQSSDQPSRQKRPFKTSGSALSEQRSSGLFALPVISQRLTSAKIFCLSCLYRLSDVTLLRLFVSCHDLLFKRPYSFCPRDCPFCNTQHLLCAELVRLTPEEARFLGYIPTCT